jgi:lipid A 3-O-deacylase
MNQLIVRNCLGLAVWSLVNFAFAQNVFPTMDEYRQVDAGGVTVLRLTIDNDSLLLNRDDGFYTSGNQISVRKALNTAQKSVIYGWQLGQDLYTASNINLAPDKILSIDHPYAGWLYTGVFREVADSTGTVSRFGLDIGCLGPCAGGARTQAQLHRFLKQALPQGWSTQLQQEWGAVVSGEWSPARWVIAKNIDVQPLGKAHFGNIFTDASIEAKLRFGQLRDLPEQNANFGFLRGEVKAIGYDATLQGGYFNNQSLSVHPRRSVGELELGYQWRSSNYGLYASLIRRSSRIKELSNNLGAQNFVRLQFNYAM